MIAPPLMAAIEPLERLAGERAAWRALASEAIEPNPYSEPDFLLASARQLGEAAALRLVTVRERGPEGRLVALLPFRRPKWREGILFGAVCLYSNPYVSLTTPLLAVDRAPEALAAALECLAALPEAPEALYLPLLAETRPAGRAVLEHAATRCLAILPVERHARASVERGQPDPDPEGGRTTRRNLDKKLRRLRRLGAVTFETITAEAPAFAIALEDFLALEASGWKGRRGTALASRAETLAFARAAFAGHAPAVILERLALDGRPLAMNLTLRASGASFTVKTAYDEAFAGLSPGMLLDLWAAERVLSDPAILRADSCARPDHPIGAVWRQREPIAALLVALRPEIPREALEPIAARIRLAATLRRALRAVEDRLRSR